MPGQVTARAEVVQVDLDDRVDQVELPRAVPPAGRRRRWRPAAVCTVVVLALFAGYFRLSWTAPVNSDGAANILQVWDILHGNLLLHGWWLSDASFYTTELPQYALIEAFLGPVPAVIHVAAAMTYTLTVVLAAFLAKGKATGRRGVFRMLIAAGIMLAPQPGGGVYVGGGTFVLDLSLGHVGTAVPLLVTWLVLDRAGTRRWVPPVVGVLLAWVLVADSLVFYVGVLPVAVVYGVRAYRELVTGRRPVRAAWFELAMAASALAAVPAAAAVSLFIRSSGGFIVYPDHPVVAAGTTLAGNLAVTFESVLTLFGANFLGLPLGFDVDAALLHLVGLVLAAWAVWLGGRRLVRGRGPGQPVDEILAVAVAANMFAFVFSTLAINPSYAREIAVVLPFSAALAGRLLPERLVSARIVPVLAVVLLGYAFTLGHGIVQLPAPTQNQQLAQWLEHRHLRYGLAGYWQASSVTLASNQRVQVRPIDLAPHGKVGAYPWESNQSWYDPAVHYATFVVLDPDGPSYHVDGTYAMVRKTFGKPARSFRVGDYIVLVWRKNLLAGLGCGEVYARSTGHASATGPQCW